MKHIGPNSSLLYSIDISEVTLAMNLAQCEGKMLCPLSGLSSQAMLRAGKKWTREMVLEISTAKAPAAAAGFVSHNLPLGRQDLHRSKSLGPTLFTAY